MMHVKEERRTHFGEEEKALKHILKALSADYGKKWEKREIDIVKFQQAVETLQGSFGNLRDEIDQGENLKVTLEKLDFVQRKLGSFKALFPQGKLENGGELLLGYNLNKMLENVHAKRADKIRKILEDAIPTVFFLPPAPKGSSTKVKDEATKNQNNSLWGVLEATSNFLTRLNPKLKEKMDAVYEEQLNIVKAAIKGVMSAEIEYEQDDIYSQTLLAQLEYIRDQYVQGSNLELLISSVFRALKEEREELLEAHARKNAPPAQQAVQKAEEVAVEVAQKVVEVAHKAEEAFVKAKQNGKQAIAWFRSHLPGGGAKKAVQVEEPAEEKEEKMEAPSPSAAAVEEIPPAKGLTDAEKKLSALVHISYACKPAVEALHRLNGPEHFTGFEEMLAPEIKEMALAWNEENQFDLSDLHSDGEELRLSEDVIGVVDRVVREAQKPRSPSNSHASFRYSQGAAPASPAAAAKPSNASSEQEERDRLVAAL